jgi:hypothetical protein
MPGVWHVEIILGHGNGPAVIYDSGDYGGYLETAIEAFKYSERINKRQGRWRLI